MLLEGISDSSNYKIMTLLIKSPSFTLKSRIFPDNILSEFLCCWQLDLIQLINLSGCKLSWGWGGGDLSAPPLRACECTKVNLVEDRVNSTWKPEKAKKAELDHLTCTCKDFSALCFLERNPRVPINLTYSKTILCLERIIFIVGVPGNCMPPPPLFQRCVLCNSKHRLRFHVLSRVELYPTHSVR